MQTIVMITKGFILLWINLIVLFVSFFIPKSDKIAVVGGWFGKRFADNSKHFYLYLNSHSSDLEFDKVIWITRSKELKDELRSNGYQVYMTWSIASIWYHLRAKYHLIDLAPIDINAFFSVRAKRINLWHGFPIKKVGTYQGDVAYNSRFFLTQFLMKLTSRGCWADHFVLATSDFAATIQAKTFGVDDSKVIVSGYPRNYGSFISNPVEYVPSYELDSLERVLNFKREGYKILGYFPTFRDKRETLIFGTEDNERLVEFLNFCETSKIKVIAKFHFAGKNDKFGNLEHRDTLLNLPSNADVYTFIKEIDVLITDYSSIYYDFLLWHKPIIFFPYDLEYYRDHDRGLIFDYDDFTPGPKIFNIDELEKMLGAGFDIITQEYQKNYHEQAEKLRDKIYGNVTEMRIDHMIKKIRDKNNS